MVALSFRSHDFGPMLVTDRGSKSAVAMLTATNLDHQSLHIATECAMSFLASRPISACQVASSQECVADITAAIFCYTVFLSYHVCRPGFVVDRTQTCIHCRYESHPELAIVGAPASLVPGATLKLPITFTPAHVLNYRAVIVVLINATHRLPIVITGQGIAARVELVQPSQKLLSFGAVSPSGSATRIVQVIKLQKKAPSYHLTRPNTADIMASSILFGFFLMQLTERDVPAVFGA